MKKAPTLQNPLFFCNLDLEMAGVSVSPNDITASGLPASLVFMLGRLSLRTDGRITSHALRGSDAFIYYEAEDLVAYAFLSDGILGVSIGELRHLHNFPACIEGWLLAWTIHVARKRGLSDPTMENTMLNRRAEHWSMHYKNGRTHFLVQEASDPNVTDAVDVFDLDSTREDWIEVALPKPAFPTNLNTLRYP